MQAAQELADQNVHPEVKIDEHLFKTNFGPDFADNNENVSEGELIKDMKLYLVKLALAFIMEIIPCS